MSTIGLFYGTQTGKTESIYSMIQEQLGADIVDLHFFGEIV
jgi:flavodoxin I